MTLVNKSFIKKISACIWLLSVLSAALCHAQDASSGNWPTVGIESAFEACLPRGDLMAAGIRERTDLILRIVAVRAGDQGYLYDFRYIGLLPGDYNLTDYLVTPDGIRLEVLPAVPVKVLPLLPQGHQGELVSSRLKAHTPPGGYKLFFTVVWIFWAILLVPLIFAGRTKKPVSEERVIPPATLDQLLRPLIEKALKGELDVSEKGRLERLLMGYWQKQLNVDEASVYLMLRKIKQHPQGAQLFEKLECWLHRPPGTASVDIEALLSPYNSISVTPDRKESVQ